MRKIVNTKLEGCESMDAYVSEIISTSQKLSEVGFDVPDEWLAIFILAGHKISQCPSRPKDVDAKDQSLFEPDCTIDVNNDSDIWTLRRSERPNIRPDYFQANFAFCMFESLAIDNEPNTVREALSGSENVCWKSAMDEEYRSLLDNNTWQLVNLPNGCKAINNKWVFKRKTDSIQLSSWLFMSTIC